VLIQPRPNAERGAEGFTLVELLVVILLVTIVGGVVLTSMVRGMQANALAQARIEAYNELTLAGERVTRELRAANPVIVAAAGQTRVRVVRDGACREFTFAVAAGTLTVQERLSGDGCITLSAGATRPILQSLDTAGATAPVFEYRDRAGLATNTPAEVATITLTLTRELPDQPSVVVSTLVSVRNS
jgi:type II secretory pathway pseudopilin PulG